jgi:hypothetical protein
MTNIKRRKMEHIHYKLHNILREMMDAHTALHYIRYHVSNTAFTVDFLLEELLTEVVNDL